MYALSKISSTLKPKPQTLKGPKAGQHLLQRCHCRLRARSEAPFQGGSAEANVEKYIRITFYHVLLYIARYIYVDYLLWFLEF